MKIHIKRNISLILLALSGLPVSATWATELSVTITTPTVAKFSEVGASNDFDCSATGGCPPYTYSWSFPDGSPSSSTDKAPTGVVFNGTLGVSRTVTVTVTDAYAATASNTVKIGFPDLWFGDELWYFSGKDAEEYFEVVTITADGLPDDSLTYEWKVTEGADKAKLIDPADDQAKDTVSASGKTIELQSCGTSEDLDDVTVQVTLGGKSVTTTTEVHYPFAVHRKPPGKTVIGGVALFGKMWAVLFEFDIKDGITDTDISLPMEFNEHITAWASDYTGEDYPAPGNVGAVTLESNPAYFSDEWALEMAGFTPTPVRYQDTGFTEKVDHCENRYRAGSTTENEGIEMLQVDISRCRGTANIED